VREAAGPFAEAVRHANMTGKLSTSLSSLRGSVSLLSNKHGESVSVAEAVRKVCFTVLFPNLNFEARTAPGQVPRTCQPEPPGFFSKFRHKPEPNLTWGL
jgi:hypothetical protein